MVNGTDAVQRRRSDDGGVWVLVGLLAAVVLVQVAVAMLGDSRFASGSDAGGRAGAIAAARTNGGCDHDLGYWAAEADPEGRFHPQVNTIATGDRFVQPASTPYVCAAGAAADGFGAPFALAVSLVGVLFAALGSWMLERQAGGDGWVSLVLVAIVGPIAFYGSDTWEHAPAAGCALFGTALLVSRHGLPAAAASGLLWGAAVSLRLETGALALTLGAALLIVGTTRRGILGRPVRTGLFGAVAVATLATDRFIERAVLTSDVRSGRAVGGSGQIRHAGSDLAQRGTDVVVTTFGVIASEEPAALVLGVALVLGLAGLGAASLGMLRSPPLLLVAALLVVVVVAVRARHLGFVPGMFVAAPVAVVGAIALLRRAEPTLARVLSGAALAALPVVWSTQWTGTLVAQWGGRYQLTSGAFLTIAGATALRRRLSQWSAQALVASAVVVGVLGLAWHIQRTRDYGRIWSDLVTTECDGALISTSSYLLREGGGTEEVQGQRVDRCRLMTAAPDDLPAALDVVRSSGLERALVLFRAADPVPDFDGPWMVEHVERRSLGRIDMVEVRLRTK